MRKTRITRYAERVDVFDYSTNTSATWHNVTEYEETEATLDAAGVWELLSFEAKLAILAASAGKGDNWRLIDE